MFLRLLRTSPRKWTCMLETVRYTSTYKCRIAEIVKTENHRDSPTTGSRNISDTSMLPTPHIRHELRSQGARLRHLVDKGNKLEALRLWKSISHTSAIEGKYWSRIGIYILCRCFRISAAEAIAEEYPELVNNNVCLWFLRAYAETRQEDRTKTWIQRLFGCKVTEAAANEVLQVLIANKLWGQAQLVVEFMSQKQYKIEPDVLAACLFNSNQRTISASSLSAILKENVTLVNSRKFRSALRQDPRLMISVALANNDPTKAVILLSKLNSSDVNRLSLEILSYLENVGSPDDLSDLVYRRVRQSPVKDDLYLRFMLNYYRFTKDYGELQGLVSQYRLMCAHPSVKGGLSYATYLTLWRLVNESLTKGDMYKHTHNINIFGTNLRGFVIATSLNVVPRGKLLEQMILSLYAIPDFAGIGGVLSFATENFGVKIGKPVLKQITGVEYEGENNWKDILLFICRAKNLNCDVMTQQSLELRELINVI